jgi:hypothetical protein
MRTHLTALVESANNEIKFFELLENAPLVGAMVGGADSALLDIGAIDWEAASNIVYTRDIISSLDPSLIDGGSSVVSSTLSALDTMIISKLTMAWNWISGIATTALSSFTDSIVSMASFTAIHFWDLIFTHWAELLILAIVTAALVWFAVKVKRWWDGTSAVQSSLLATESRLKTRLNAIEKKLDMLINKATSTEEKNMMRSTFKFVKKHVNTQSKQIKKEYSTKLQTLPKQQGSGTAVASYIRSLRVNTKQVHKQVKKVIKA